jgi:hypothetical protein
MMRAYAFLSLLIITGALRAPALAQQPTTQSPTITRQSSVAEALRRRLPPPAIETPEEPILRIETVALRPDPNAGSGAPNPLLKNLSVLRETALFQRQRFRETGQPMELERGGFYYRQDRHVATKGVILYSICNDRIDFGFYKRSFHNEASPARAEALRYGLYDSSNRNDKFNHERQYFFGVRFKLGKTLQQNK